jgi:hypothetical protein
VNLTGLGTTATVSMCCISKIDDLVVFSSLNLIWNKVGSVGFFQVQLASPF